MWLFGPRTDVAAFAGSALLAGVLAVLAPRLGLAGETPLWAWVALVVGIDVAHVWATLARTYLDAEEVGRRPLLYGAAPLLAWGGGVLAWLLGGAGLFWRLLAYAALFHFVRQQVGWVALYGRRAGVSSLERRLDAAAVYAATLGPALWWHARLPRPFWWFVEGDFAPLPSWVGPLALAGHAGVLAAWALFQGARVLRGAPPPWGKWLLVAATWGTWFGGIVLAEDDFTFTVTNVTLHGVPYFVLLWRYARGRAAEPQGEGTWVGRWVRLGVPGFLAGLWALALAEEWLWDRLLWHERPLLFGTSTLSLPPEALALLVPLLALPQATHYLLDAFIWKPGRDTRLLSRLGWLPAGRCPADDAGRQTLPAGVTSSNV